MSGLRYASRVRLGMFAVIVACGIAACGSSASSKPSASKTSSSGISSAKLASLQAQVTAAEKVPAFTNPGPPASASGIKGTSLVVFPVNSEIGACQTQAEDFKALGTSLGAHVTLVSNSGQPSQWTTAVDSAVASHDKAVAMLCGVIPGAIGPELTAAKKANVAVVDGNYNETSDYTGLDGETAVETAAGMKEDVADALVNLKGKPLHALVVYTDSIIQGPDSDAAITSAMKSDCGSAPCSVTGTIVVPIQNWATAVQSDVASALVSHPTTNAVIVIFDGMTQFVLPAVQSSHISGLKIYTWGGSLSVEKLMQAPNSLVAADVGLDEQWDAYDAMDQVIRLADHKPPVSVNKELDPNVMFTPSNVASFFGPGGTYGNKAWGGNAFINGFDKLWGVS